MRLGFVIPWRDLGSWVWAYLPQDITGDLLFAAPEPGHRGPRLPPYLGEFYHLAKRHPRLDRYDVLFAWELRSALAVGLLRKLTGQRRAAFVPVGPILKGNLLKILPVVRWLLSDAERIICVSRAECDDYARLLRMPRERFIFCPTPWLSDEEVSSEDDHFILALGQSNRDYGTLIRAVRGTSLPVEIVAYDDSVLGGEQPPENVRVRYGTGHEETNALIGRATFHVVPLHARTHSAGQTVVLRAMARGKAVVVSDTPGIRDYVSETTARLVPPEDEVALRHALCELWENAPEREKIGQAAARSIREDFGFHRFTQRLIALAKTLRGTTTGMG